MSLPNAPVDLQPPVLAAGQRVRPRCRGHHTRAAEPPPQQRQDHGHLRGGRRPHHPQSERRAAIHGAHSPARSMLDWNQVSI